jgi:DNA-binding transcriptional MerR regulator
MPTAFADILDSVPATGLPIEALVELANHALDAAHVAVEDGRATERLDVRTVRFYQTLGVLPKPEYEGRRALYGREHLVRAVAAKQLQSEGYTLAQIQSALPAQGFDELTQALLALDAPNTRAAAAPPTRRATESSRALHAYELAPGVTVTVDPALVADPDALARTLRRALAADDGTRRDATRTPNGPRPTHPNHGGNQ